MPLLDGLIVLGIFGGFGLLMWARLVKSKHPIVQKTKDWISKPLKDKESNLENETMQQIYTEKRQIM